jgi:hypothetical protein
MRKNNAIRPSVIYKNAGELGELASGTAPYRFLKEENNCIFRVPMARVSSAQGIKNRKQMAQLSSN